MNQRMITGMGAAAVLLAAAAMTLDSSRDAAAAWSRTDEPLFPGLKSDAEDVTTFVVESASGITTLERDGEAWTVAERGGFAGRADEVGRLLFALAEATRLERKTSKPELYEKLGLGGFEDEASQTVRVTLKKAGGEVAADMFVGRRRFLGAGESWYVREPDEATAWAVEAKLRTPKGTAEWLETELFDVRRERIARVLVEHADGDRVSLVRTEPDASHFDIEDIPEGREPASQRSGAAFLGALGNLRLSDVQPVAQAELPDPAPIVTTFWTKDGLRVTAHMMERGDDLLARFEAAYDPAPTPAGEIGPGGEMGPPLPDEPPLGEAEGGAEGEAGDGLAPPAPVAVPGLDPEPDEPPPTPEEIEQEAEDINALSRGWVFTLPSWKKSSFVTTTEDLLKALPEEETEEETVEEPEDEPVDETVEETPADPDEESVQETEQDTEETDDDLGDPAETGGETGEGGGDEGDDPPTQKSSGGGGDGGDGGS